MANQPVNSKEKITIKHVAKDAGVSVAAVSKVMRNAYGVSDKLRAKVLKSIEKLDYRPSTAARAMRGRTYTVGVLLVEMENPFLATVVQGLKSTLNTENYKFFVGVGQAQESLEQALIDSMIDMHMDGVILIAPRLSGTQLEKYARQIPMVVVGHHEPESEAFDTINSDDIAGAQMAVQTLLKGGHKKIKMISLKQTGSGSDVPATRERGYIQAMQDAGLDDEIEILYIREKPGRKGLALETVFDLSPPAEAIFCWSDLHGVDLICQAKARGLAVPEDLAIISYDNNALAQLPLVDLSSVDQHGGDIGSCAATTILSRIDGRKDAKHVLIAPELKLRSSS